MKLIITDDVNRDIRFSNKQNNIYLTLFDQEKVHPYQYSISEFNKFNNKINNEIQNLIFLIHTNTEGIFKQFHHIIEFYETRFQYYLFKRLLVLEICKYLIEVHNINCIETRTEEDDFTNFLDQLELKIIRPKVNYFKFDLRRIVYFFGHILWKLYSKIYTLSLKQIDFESSFLYLFGNEISQEFIKELRSSEIVVFSDDYMRIRYLIKRKANFKVIKLKKVRLRNEFRILDRFISKKLNLNKKIFKNIVDHNEFKLALKAFNSIDYLNHFRVLVVNQVFEGIQAILVEKLNSRTKKIEILHGIIGKLEKKQKRIYRDYLDYLVLYGKNDIDTINSQWDVNEIPKVECLTIGIPRFEKYYSISKSKDLPSIFVIFEPLGSYYEHTDEITLFLQEILPALTTLDGLKVIIKFHPRQTKNEKKYIRNYLSKRLSRETLIFYDSLVDSSILNKNLIVIHQNSTLALELMIANKIIINLKIKGSKLQPSDAYVEFGYGYNVNNKIELIEVLNSIKYNYNTYIESHKEEHHNSLGHFYNNKKINSSYEIAKKIKETLRSGL